MDQNIKRLLDRFQMECCNYGKFSDSVQHAKMTKYYDQLVEAIEKIEQKKD